MKLLKVRKIIKSFQLINSLIMSALARARAANAAAWGEMSLD